MKGFMDISAGFIRYHPPAKSGEPVSARCASGAPATPGEFQPARILSESICAEGHIGNHPSVGALITCTLSEGNSFPEKNNIIPDNNPLLLEVFQPINMLLPSIGISGPAFPYFGNDIGIPVSINIADPGIMAA